MKFDYFNSEIDYKGQDLHMLRNGISFPLYSFFDTSAHSATFKYRLKGDYSSLNYDNITITPNNEIIAVAFNPPLRPIIDNFYVEITINNQIALVLIHIHDSLDEIWTSPQTLSLRQGMAIKFGILANFINGNYADFSFYPEFEFKIKQDDAIELNAENRIKWNTTPSSLPYEINDAIEIKIPRYLRNSDEFIFIKGDIVVVEDNDDSLELICGDTENIHNKLNILCLSDGFDGTELADQNTFKNYVSDIRTHMLESDFLTPWNLFAASDKINLWSYYTKDKSNIATHEGEYIIIDSNGMEFSVSDLYSFIYLFDKYIISNIKNSINLTLNEFINILNSSSKYNITPKLLDYLNLSYFKTNEVQNPLFPLLKFDKLVVFISLSDLCLQVGLPSINDLNKNFQDKANEWITLKWNIMKGGKKIKFPFDDDVSTNDFFLHEYVFLQWKKLGIRKHLEKSDTTYGISNNYLNRSQDIFQPAVELNFSNLKFKHWKEFSLFVNRIGGIQFPKLGTHFYNENGDAVITSVAIGEETIDDIVFKKHVPNQANNIIILSRLHQMHFAGYNHQRTINLVETKITTTLHRSIICLENTNKKNILFQARLIESKRYKLGKIVIPSNLNHVVKNTFVHEFSHNYLLDEYNNQQIKFTELPYPEQKKESENLKFSNLQTNYDLLTIKPPAAGGQITVQNIKWLWPRISVIEIGNIVTKSGDKLNFLLKPLETNHSFKVNDVILFRKASLFYGEHIHCKIETIITTETRTTIVVKPSKDVTIDSSYLNNYFLIAPYWIDSSTYQELVHPITKNWIEQNNKALVEKSEFNEIQTIEGTGSVFEVFTNKSNVVGLYAGGSGLTGYSEGVYHATGFCIMRNTDPKDNDRNSIANSFCQICRYILVDQIDPTLHPILDKEYGNDYPGFDN